MAEIELAETLVVDGRVAYALNPTSGQVQAVAPETDSPAWTVDDLQGARSLVTSGDLSTSRCLGAQGRRSGPSDRRAGPPNGGHGGLPWSLAVVGDEVAVALAGTSSVARLELDTLESRGAPTTRRRVDPAGGGQRRPLGLLAGAAQLTASPDPRGQMIATRSQLPALATNGQVLAVGGVEIVSTLWPDGQLFRNRYHLRHAASMAVTSRGDVLATTDNSVVFIRSSLRGEDP